MNDLYLKASPDIYPEHIDIVERQVRLCSMSRDSYRDSPFLDHRIVRAATDVRMLSFDALQAYGKIPAPAPVCYIFHNAFCCSTLLTRYLDGLYNTLVLREPHVLFEVASYLRFRNTNLFKPVPEDDLERLYRYITCMLSRRYRDDETVIIKPTDGCNNLIAELMTDNPENRAIFLHSGLERFLSSIFRVPERGEWAKIRVRELSLDKQRREGQLPYHPEQLDRGQTAAMVWALHMERFRAFIHGDGLQRALVTDSQELVEQPAPVLGKIAKHLGISVTDEELQTVAGTAATSRNAKAQNEAYDSNTREQDFRQSREQHAAAISKASSWLEDLYGREFIANPLGSH